MGGVSAVVPGVTETSGVAVAISPDVVDTGKPDRFGNFVYY